MSSPAPQILALTTVRAGAIVARVAAAWTRWRNRRQVAELLSLDDHLLADLGVARGDVFEALSCPPARDASASLGVHADRARQQEAMRLRESLRSARVLNMARPERGASAAPVTQVGHVAA